MVKNIFVPDIYIKNYYDINLSNLKNIKIILLDADNTIVNSYDNFIDLKSIDFINYIKSKKINPIIFSNNTESRISNIAKKLNCDYSSFSMKPLPFSYKKILKKYNVKNEEVLVVGDQILTDIIGGNLMDMKTILVEPTSKKDNIAGKISRIFEKIVFLYLSNKNYLKKGKYYGNM